MHTVGVVIDVPPPHGPRLDAYRARIGGRPGQTPAHITLVPPTAVDPERWDETLHHVAEVARTQPAFDVHLRGTGTFQPVSPVVFIGVVAGISSCEGLAARLRSGPLRSESAFPYHPHVTIAHDVDADRLGRAFVEQSGFEARFRVEAFTVYVQERLDGWRAVGEFGLGG